MLLYVSSYCSESSVYCHVLSSSDESTGCHGVSVCCYQLSGGLSLWLCMLLIIVSLQLLADDDNFSTYQLISLDTACYMRLDSSAAKALNLDPVSGEPQTSCLSGLLNKCRTAQGQRLMSQWLKQPLIDKSCIGEGGSGAWSV